MGPVPGASHAHIAGETPAAAEADLERRSQWSAFKEGEHQGTHFWQEWLQLVP